MRCSRRKGNTNFAGSLSRRANVQFIAALVRATNIGIFIVRESVQGISVKKTYDKPTLVRRVKLPAITALGNTSDSRVAGSPP